MKPGQSRDALAVYLHQVRTAFAVYQGNAFLCKQKAVPASVRRDAARRLIETLQKTERLDRPDLGAMVRDRR